MAPCSFPPHTEAAPGWWRPALLALTAPLLALPLLFALPAILKVPAYHVSGGQITARSVASRTVIPAGTPVAEQAVRLTGKVVGSAAAGYTVGRFDTPQRNVVRMYSDGSHTTRALVFATRPEATILTPADPQALLRVWRSGGRGEFRPAQPAGYDPFLLLFALLSVPLTAFLFSRPQVTYTPGEDTLVVRTARSVTRLPRTATATLTCDGLGLRLFGTAMPGYYTGTFVTNGGNVQAAATTARPAQAVVVTHGERRYYLTPQDPHALAEWFTPAGEGGPRPA